MSVTGLPGTPPCTDPDPPSTTVPPDSDHPEDYLLPISLRPYHYDIELRPDIYLPDPTDFVFNGTSSMHFACLQDTNRIVLHIRQLTIENSTIEVVPTSGGASVSVQSTEWREQFDFYEVTLSESLVAGVNYTITTRFTGPLTGDMSGMYWSSYLEHNTTR